MLEKIFKLKENNTNVKTELLAGLTTFMTMAYILAVNPSILSACGMDKNAILVATALAAFVGTMCMAIFANHPFALAPGMGLNAYFAYTVCLEGGLDWRIALLAVFVEGIIFILLSATNIREAIFKSIPMTLKYSVSAGIGLFIAFIGLQDSKIVVNNDSTLVSIVNFKDNFNSVGIGALLAIIGVLIISVLYVKKVKGSILYGIIITWVLGMLAQACGLYVPNAELGMYSLYPSFDNWNIFGTYGNLFGQVFKADMSNVNIWNFIVIVLSFLFVDLFDTLGTLIGVSSKAGILDKEGNMPRIKGALMADAVATTAGAVLGTSTTTTYVESATGVAAGGRTGLTAVTTAVLFLVSLVLAPVFVALPSFAIAPALIFVGVLMFTSVANIDFTDYSEMVPAFLCIAAMPLMYSVAEGISMGVISYVVINLLCGKFKEKKISIVMVIIAILFVLKYIFL